MIVIGITGPTGAGKTTALNELKELGGCILDADVIYHELLSGSADLRHELEARFGPMTDGEGHFDRKKLGAVVFHAPAALADLNAIAHRYVVREISERLAQAEQAGRPVAAIDAIGLFESGADKLCRTTLAITAPAEIRVQRIMAREGISEEYARSRVNAQNPDSFYTSRCQHVLVNDCASAEEFASRARALFTQILRENEIGFRAERRPY